MFTGLTAAVGRVTRITPLGGDLRLEIAAGELDWSDVAPGDSIATNGVCLTVAGLGGGGFLADVSSETLAATTLPEWRPGQAVNLEKALRASDRLGGHIVTGHVDGVAEVLTCRRDARSLRLQLLAPALLARYIARKGSVAIDGVSLTINRTEGRVFELNIVPHSAGRTIIAQYGAGSRVNLEVDIIARYLERLLCAGEGSPPDGGGGIDLRWLADHGFHS